MASRPVRHWIGRGLLAAGALVVAYLAGSNTLAQRLATSNPAAAHRLAAGDGRILGLRAASLAAAPEASPEDRRRSDALARAALRRDPIDVNAVAALGLNAQARGDAPAARRLFALAEQLSRRDRLTQLWAIEDAVARGDIAGALRHYDTALRASPDLSAVLYPVLAAASADPSIRTALIRTLAGGADSGRPDWGSGFVYHLAGNGPDPQATAALLLGLRRAGVPVADSASAATIDALVNRGLQDRAWDYYAAIRPGADRRRSRDPGFAANIEPPSPFDWVAVNDGDVATAIQGGVFDFTAPAAVGGVLLRQAQLLPPGEYRLAGHGEGIGQDGGGAPFWTLACRDGRELGRVAIVPREDGRFEGRFRVPPGCPVQQLSLVAPVSEASAGVSGRIDRAELAPLASAGGAGR